MNRPLIRFTPATGVPALCRGCQKRPALPGGDFCGQDCLDKDRQRAPVPFPQPQRLMRITDLPARSAMTVRSARGILQRRKRLP